MIRALILTLPLCREVTSRAVSLTPLFLELAGNKDIEDGNDDAGTDNGSKNERAEEHQLTMQEAPRHAINNEKTDISERNREGQNSEDKLRRENLN